MKEIDDTPLSKSENEWHDDYHVWLLAIEDRVKELETLLAKVMEQRVRVLTDDDIDPEWY